MKNIYFIVNGNARLGMSGGDKNYIEVAKFLKKKERNKISIITNSFGKIICEKEGLRGINYILTDHNNTPINNPVLLVLYYIFRGLKSLIIIYRIKKNTSFDNNYFILTSDFYCDTISLLGLRNEKKLLIMNMVANNPFIGYENKIHAPKLNEIHYFLSNFLTFIFIKLFTEKNNFRIVATTDFIKKKLINNWFLANREIVVVNCGADYDKEFIDDVNRKNNKIYDFVWIGRNHPQKGVEDLKKIILILKEKKKDFKMLIIGEVCEALIKFRSDNKLQGNLFMEGVLFNEMKFKKLSESKIFLFTSHFESFGIVVLENMLVRNLVIGYAIDSNVENYSNKMIIINKFDYLAFAENAMLALKNYPEKKLLDSNEKFAARFTWGNAGRRYNQLINSFN